MENKQQRGSALNIIIDEEFRSTFPPLSAEEFSRLEDSILTAGRIRDPLVVWRGILVDGHSRFLIIQKHPNIPFSICEEKFADRYEAIVWICKNQLVRRNLTPKRWTYLLGKQYEAEKKTHGGDRKSKEAKSSGQIDHQRTCERIALENKVGERTVRRAEKYALGVDAAETVWPGIRDEILSGSIKASHSELSAIEQATPEERKKLVDLLVHRPEGQSGEVVSNETRPLINSIETSLPETEQMDNMLGEMEDALDTVIYRWERCFSIYHELMQHDYTKKEVRVQVRKLKKYLMKIEEELKHGEK